MKSAQSNEEIAAFFDRCARQGEMLDFPAEEQAKLAEFFGLWEIEPGHRILEPGCGSGRLTAELAKEVGPEGEIFACDLSPGMLRVARERNLPPWVRMDLNSVRNICYPDNWFDRVICLNVFPHFNEVQTILNEFSRVLKPNGALWITHFEGRESLNRFHQHAAPEVSDHALPCPYTMRSLMTEAKLEIELLEDCIEHYLLKARKVLGSSHHHGRLTGC